VLVAVGCSEGAETKSGSDEIRKAGASGVGKLEIAHRLGIRRAIRVHGVLAAKDRPASFYE
jgi:hypothetical protein